MSIKKKLFVKTFKASRIGKRPLLFAADEKQFFMRDGSALRSIADLESALRRMSDADYEHHVSMGHNDFAQWVDQVLRDEECAILLRTAASRKSAHSIVQNHLDKYDLE
jgi:hypothetical protein